MAAGGAPFSWILFSYACIALINLVHSQRTVCVARGSNNSAHAHRAIKLRHPKESVIISSPNFPQKYVKNVQCTWRIEAPDRCTIKFSYMAFDLGEPHLSGTCHDFLILREGGRAFKEGHSLRKECGNSKPPDIQSKSKVVWIRFTSDSTTEKTGFSLKVHPVCASSKARRYSILAAIFLGMLVIIVAVIICRRRPKGRTNPTQPTQSGINCQQVTTPTNSLCAVMPSTSHTISNFLQLDQEARSSTDKNLSDPLASSLSRISLVERQLGLTRGDQQNAEQAVMEEEKERQILEILV